jgi:hypothetical protein
MAGLHLRGLHCLVFTLLTLLIFASFCALTKAEAPLVQWDKTYEPVEGDSVVQTADGGYAMAGLSGDRFFDGYTNVTDVLIKTDSAGNMQWNKTFQNNPSPNILLVNTKDGGYAIAEGIIIPFRAAVWFVKTDANGNEQWNRTYQEPGYYAMVNSMIQTGNGGYALAGGIWGDEWTSGKGNKAWVVKTDSTGNVQWQRAYDNFSSLDNAVEVRSFARSIVETADGGYIFTCWTDSNASVLVKLSPQGTVQWNKKYEGPSIEFRSIVKANDSRYVLAGVMNGCPYAIKVDSSGNTQWNRTYKNWDFLQSAVQSKEGGYMFAGTTYYGNVSWLVKTDFQGNVEWNATYYRLGQGRVSSVLQADDGGYVFTGWTELSFHANSIWLVTLLQNLLPLHQVPWYGW